MMMIMPKIQRQERDKRNREEELGLTSTTNVVMITRFYYVMRRCINGTNKEKHYPCSLSTIGTEIMVKTWLQC